MQQGDDFSRSDIGSDRVALFANGLPMELSTERLSKSVLIMEDTEKSIEEWTLYPVGIEMICWKAPLKIGVHEVLFAFKQTSGDIQEYTWFLKLKKTPIIVSTQLSPVRSASLHGIRKRKEGCGRVPPSSFIIPNSSLFPVVWQQKRDLRPTGRHILGPDAAAVGLNHPSGNG